MEMTQVSQSVFKTILLAWCGMVLFDCAHSGQTPLSLSSSSSSFLSSNSSRKKSVGCEMPGFGPAFLIIPFRRILHPNTIVIHLSLPRLKQPLLQSDERYLKVSNVLIISPVDFLGFSSYPCSIYLPALFSRIERVDQTCSRMGKI